MPYLPSWTEKPKTTLERFIHDNEPAGLEDAAAFRDGLIKVLNAEGVGNWSEHPDSLYLEKVALEGLAEYRAGKSLTTLEG